MDNNSNLILTPTVKTVKTVKTTPEQERLTRLTRSGMGMKNKITIQERCQKYVDRMPSAVSKQDGHVQALVVARAIFWGFDLSEGDGWPLLLAYNSRCQPPWSESELRRKMTQAMKPTGATKPRGSLANNGVGGRQRGRGDRDLALARARQDSHEQRKREEVATLHKQILATPWPLCDVWESSPVRFDGENDHDPRLVLNLFPRDATVFIGELCDSGQEQHRENFQPATHWLTHESQVAGRIGLSAYKAGSFSRTKESVERRFFGLIESDNLASGKRPESQEDIEQLKAETLSRCHWLVNVCHWRLAWILSTGGKSLHCVFYWHDSMATSKAALAGIGIDPAPLLNITTTSRLPNTPHEKTGQRARLLWCNL